MTCKIVVQYLLLILVFVISETVGWKYCFRKPHKTHKIVTDSSNTSNQVAFAETDIDVTSNIKESHSDDVTQPSRPSVTPSKLSSEPLGLPEGINILYFIYLIL